MRLINTQTGLFEEFVGTNMPKYAILSHTWDEDEVSFAAMAMGSCHHLKGHQKIAATCRIASESGLNYAWIDTCCIDKSSSSELSEAINSMYRWYQRSEICYVFLSDLPADSMTGNSLKRCRWFTRGWTLQELIAPRKISFFDQVWKYRGSKDDLISLISEITGISLTILQGSQPLKSVAVAQKMSWAAHRETTRVEDKAYSLFGIFDVNMPLLYGEEEKAFRRLQEEIIKSTADFSIFAWRLPSPITSPSDHKGAVFCGILAPSPRYFAESRFLLKMPGQVWQDFSVTNNGIRMESQILCERVLDKDAFRYILPLHCRDPMVPVGVRIRMCGPSQYVREDPWDFVKVIRPLSPRTSRVKYLLTELSAIGIYTPSALFRSIAETRSHALQIHLPVGMSVTDAWPLDRFDDQDRVFFTSGDVGRDSAVVNLTTTVQVSPGQNITFRSMFYALGWSSLDDQQLQCSIVDYGVYGFTPARVDEAQTEISKWDYDRYTVSHILIKRKIPKTSAVSFEIPGSTKAAVVSFRTNVVRDPDVSQNRFWRIEFSCGIYEAQQVPNFHDGTWRCHD